MNSLEYVKRYSIIYYINIIIVELNYVNQGFRTLVCSTLSDYIFASNELKTIVTMKFAGFLPGFEQRKWAQIFFSFLLGTIRR